MPKQSSVKPEEIINHACEESSILSENEEVPGPTHELWKRISDKLESRITPKNVYTIVRANRHNILSSIKEKLGVCHDSTKKGPLLSTTDDDDENTSSSSSDQEVTDTSLVPPEKTFKVVIPHEDFETMQPVYTKMKSKKQGKLRPRFCLPPYIWADKIAHLIWDQHKLPCPFAIKNSQANVNSSVGEYYITVNAYCTDPKCKNLAKGIIAHKPISGEPVEMEWRCRDTRGITHSAKRFLKGSVRAEIGKKLAHSSCTVFRRLSADKLMDICDQKEPPTLYREHVLRKAKQEFKDLQYNVVHGNDPILCLEVMKHNQPHCGSIHDISLDKFFVHYYTQMQLHTYTLLCRSNYVVLIIDATGSLVKKIIREHGESQHIFLYEGVVHTGKHQIPVVQMLSEKQDSNTILYWLNEWQRCGAPSPREVVTDESKALQSAVCRSFGRCYDIRDYKEKCFQHLMNETGSLPACYIRVDVAHMIKSCSKWKLWKIDCKRVKDFYLRCLGILIKSQSLKEFEDVLKNILIVATSKEEGIDKEEKPVAMEQSLQMLMEKIEGIKNIEDELVVKDVEYEDEEVLDNVESNKEKQEEPFIPLIENWLATIKLFVDERCNERGNRINPYYAPSVAEKFTTIVKDFVLWSGVMGPLFKSPYRTASSASVESDFSDLKRRILKNEHTPLLVHKFLDIHLQSIAGHLKLAQMALKSNISDEKESKVIDENKIEGKTKQLMSFNPKSIAAKHAVDVEDDHEDLNFFENWRRKISKTERPKKSKYLNSFPEITLIGKSLKPPMDKLIKNGNNCQPIRMEQNKYVSVKNTCTFDALTSLLMNAYVENPTYRSSIDISNNLTMKTAKSLAVVGANLDTYKLRAQAISRLSQPSNTMITQKKQKNIITEEYDLWSNLTIVTKSLLDNEYSAIVHIHCSNEFCTRITEEKHVILDTDSFIVCSQGLGQLSESIESSIKKGRPSIYDCSSAEIKTKCLPPCTGDTTITVIGQDHLLIDTDYIQYTDNAKEQNKLFDRKCTLNEIPICIEIGDQEYYLNGLVAFRPGHYVTYTKRHGSDTWELYDGLARTVLKHISNKEKVCPHLIMYTKKFKATDV